MRYAKALHKMPRERTNIMKILVDTNILFSAILFLHSKPEVLLAELSYELISATCQFLEIEGLEN